MKPGGGTIMKMKNLLLGALIVTCLAISAHMLVGRDHARKAKRRDLANELAAWIARESSAGGKGAALVLAPLETTGDPFPGQLARRLDANLRGAGFDPVESETVAYNPALESTGEPVTHERFLELLRSHPQASIVVSLVGIPNLTPADLPAANRPRIVVASTVIMPHLKTLPPGLIDFAIEVKHDRNDPRTDASLGELSKYFVLHRPK